MEYADKGLGYVQNKHWRFQEPCFSAPMRLAQAGSGEVLSCLVFLVFLPSFLLDDLTYARMYACIIPPFVLRASGPLRVATSIRYLCISVLPSIYNAIFHHLYHHRSPTQPNPTPHQPTSIIVFPPPPSILKRFDAIRFDRAGSNGLNHIYVPTPHGYLYSYPSYLSKIRIQIEMHIAS